MMTQETNPESGYYQFGKKIYLVTVYPEYKKIRAAEVFEDGSGTSTFSQEDSFWHFQEAIREGRIVKLKKLPKLPRKNDLKVTLDLNNYDKNELELFMKEKGLKNLEEVFKALIQKGIYGYREDRD